MGHKCDWNLNFWGYFINSWGGAHAIADSLPLGDLRESQANCATSGKCYLNTGNVGVVQLEDIPQPFNGIKAGDPTEEWRWISAAGEYEMGNKPRALSLHFDAWGLGYSNLVYNIDNYVSWMWNRWLDHGFATLAPP